MRLELSGRVARLSANALRLTLSETLAIATTGPKRYRVYQIEKRSGGLRTICQPSRELKALQYVLIRNLLRNLPVHEAATAYVVGGSIRENAARHASGRVLYKIDFRAFFPSIQAGDWAAYAREHLKDMTLEDVRFTQHVLFWGAGDAKPRCLSIGAPSSPYLSNALMFSFDKHLSEQCALLGVTYTRYADDLTFSTKGHLDKQQIRQAIRGAIQAGFVPRLDINEDKTVLVSKATRRRVTGLIVTNDGLVSLGRDRKRLISCMVDHVGKGDLASEKLPTLRGWLAFANDVEPDFVVRLRHKYSTELIDRLLKNEPLELL